MSLRDEIVRILSPAVDARAPYAKVMIDAIVGACTPYVANGEVLSNTISFFTSAIKSGESWDQECEDALAKARKAFATIPPSSRAAEIEAGAEAMFVRLSESGYTMPIGMPAVAAGEASARMIWREIKAMPHQAPVVMFYREHARVALEAADKVRASTC